MKSVARTNPFGRFFDKVKDNYRRAMQFHQEMNAAEQGGTPWALRPIASSAARPGVGMPVNVIDPAAMATARFYAGCGTAEDAARMGAAVAPDGRGGYAMAYGR